MKASLFPSLAQSRAFPTAASLTTIPQVVRHRGTVTTSDTLVYCDGTLIGLLRTTTFAARKAGDRPTVVKSTVRCREADTQLAALPGHDIEWLLREHIDIDLGGRDARMALLKPGHTFFATEDILLRQDELPRKLLSCYIPTFARLTITELADEFVTFRWNVTLISTTDLERRDFIDGKTDTILHETFAHLVSTRQLMPFCPAGVP